MSDNLRRLDSKHEFVWQTEFEPDMCQCKHSKGLHVPGECIGVHSYVGRFGSNWTCACPCKEFRERQPRLMEGDNNEVKQALIEGLENFLRPGLFMPRLKGGFYW